MDIPGQLRFWLMKVLELKPAVNVIGVIGAAHNAIGENAFFPETFTNHLVNRRSTVLTLRKAGACRCGCPFRNETCKT